MAHPIRLRAARDEPLRDASFRRFWLGQSVAMMGAQVSLLAIPLAAVLSLGATPVELGLLQAAAYLPFVIVILPIGVLVDRRRRRPLLVAANVLRGLVLAAVPVAALAGVLSLSLLMVVALVGGTLTVLFEVAYLAYVPSLVPQRGLGAANARLQGSLSVAQIGGPGLAGVLVATLGAPIAIAVDAVSLLFAGTMTARVDRSEPEPDAGRAVALRTAIVEGLRFVVGHPLLRALAGEAAMFNLLWTTLDVALLFLLTRTLHWDAATIGLAFSAGSAGALLGALAIGPIAERVGFGRAISLVMLVGTVPFVGLAAASDGLAGLGVVAAVLAAGSFGVGGAGVLAVTTRQTATPAALLGRAAATYRLLTYGVVPIGAILGGLLVETIGARDAVLVAGLGIAVAPAWIFLSPLPRLGSVDEAADVATWLGSAARSIGPAGGSAALTKS